jgi:hypothetical protein
VDGNFSGVFVFVVPEIVKDGFGAGRDCFTLAIVLTGMGLIFGSFDPEVVVELDAPVPIFLRISFAFRSPTFTLLYCLELGALPPTPFGRSVVAGSDLYVGAPVRGFAPVGVPKDCLNLAALLDTSDCLTAVVLGIGAGFVLVPIPVDFTSDGLA